MTEGTLATSCTELYSVHPHLPDGEYWIILTDPFNGTDVTMKIYCHAMSTGPRHHYITLLEDENYSMRARWTNVVAPDCVESQEWDRWGVHKFSKIAINHIVSRQ